MSSLSPRRLLSACVGTRMEPKERPSTWNWRVVQSAVTQELGELLLPDFVRRSRRWAWQASFRPVGAGREATYKQPSAGGRKEIDHLAEWLQGLSFHAARLASAGTRRPLFYRGIGMCLSVDGDRCALRVRSAKLPPLCCPYSFVEPVISGQRLPIASFKRATRS